MLRSRCIWNYIKSKQHNWTVELKYAKNNDSNLIVNMHSQQPWQIILQVRLASHNNWLTDARYKRFTNPKTCLDKYTQEVPCMVSKKVGSSITMAIHICVFVSVWMLPLWAKSQQYCPSWRSLHKWGGEIRWGHGPLLALAACSRK